MNLVALIGRLTTNPELKTTPSGVSVTSFSLAVDRAYTPKGAEKQTDFINCVAWRGTAEFVTRYFSKGKRMAVKGELQQRTYTAKDGSNRTVYEVVVDNAFFCESKERVQSVSSQDVNGVENDDFDEHFPVDDDDLPF